MEKDCQSELMNFIIKYNNQKKTIRKLEDFVAIFSYFIYLNDESYRYNRPYLSEQFKKFEMFLSKAYEKWTVLKNVADKVNSTKEIINSLNHDMRLVISINDFLKIDFLTKCIEFCEEPSVSGANRRLKDSVLTIELYKGKVKMLKTYQYQTLNNASEEIEQNCNEIIEVVKGMFKKYEKED